MDSHTVWKKIEHELRELLSAAIFVVPFYLSFTALRRFEAGESGRPYLAYGMALINSLILAKVILIGEIAHLGKRSERRPLIDPTVVKAALFTALQLAFIFVEGTARGMLHHDGVLGALRSSAIAERRELVVHALVFFFAFIPFCALRELRRVLGEQHFQQLFIGKRSPQGELRPGDPR